MTFRKFVKKGVKEVTIIPHNEEQGSLVVDAGSSGIQNECPEVSSAVNPLILNIDMSDVQAVSASTSSRGKKKRDGPRSSGTQSVAGRLLKRKKVVESDKDTVFREPAAPKSDLHDQEILEWLNGEDMNVEDVKKIDNMDNETFLRVFKKDRQLHTYLDAVITRRFSRMSVDLRSKNLEMHSLSTTIEDLKAREARFVTTVKASNIVQDLRRQINLLKVDAIVHDEAVLKLQDEFAIKREVAKLLRDQIDLLKEDRVRLITEVIPHVTKSLLYSDEVGQLLGELTSAERAEERSTVLEEFSAEGKCDFRCRGDFAATTYLDLEVADQKWKEASFLFLEKIIADPNAAVDDLLKITPNVIQPEVAANPQ